MSHAVLVPLPETGPPALPRAPGTVVPLLVAEAAAWRYVEFFAANTRNSNTRRAYARACVSITVAVY